MAAKSGTQLLTDVTAVVTSIDAAIASPSDTTSNAIVAACDVVLAGCADSPAVRESNHTHGNATGTPVADIAQLVGAIKKDTLAIARRGEVTYSKGGEVGSSYRILKKRHVQGKTALAFQRERPLST